MKIRIIVFAFLLCSQFPLKADMGYAYWFKVQIETKDNNLFSGYFYLATYELGEIENISKRFFDSKYPIEDKCILLPSNNQDFDRKIQSIIGLYKAPINLFPDILRVPTENGRIYGSLGTPTLIRSEKIQEIKVFRLVDEVVGEFIYVPPESKKEDWLNQEKPLKQIEITSIPPNACNYAALFFGDSSSTISKNLECFSYLRNMELIISNGNYDISKKEREELNQEIEKVMNDLWKEKVVIMTYCSC